MKSTSKKSTGLLGGFDFQPIFSEHTLSRSEPKEEEVSPVNPNEAEQEQIKPSDAADSHTKPSEAELSCIKPKQAKDSQRQPSDAVLGESKPKKLKQAKEVQRLIEQGDVPGALLKAGLTKKKIPMPKSHQGVASGDGKRSKRITILMSEEERKYINREARRHGMTIGQFVYALAVAAAEGKIELEDFLED
nr:MAG TPA: NikA, BACTERIAL CONJUGATION, RELAXASE, DNA [Caudoviricetes sp.]